MSGLVTVEKYSSRSWAVYVGGELLCVTVYKKGAMAVKSCILELQCKAEGSDQLSMLRVVA